MKKIEIEIVCPICKKLFKTKMSKRKNSKFGYRIIDKSFCSSKCKKKFIKLNRVIK